MIELKLMSSAAKGEVSANDYIRGKLTDLDRFCVDFHRPVNIRPLAELLDEAMHRFRTPAQSDAWLAPRVHAALRLTRAEASDQRLWRYIALANRTIASYIRWRWSIEDPEGDLTKTRNIFLVRTTGPYTKHAIARLWWGAEVFRNGSDYRTVLYAFSNQDIPNTWLGILAANHRPTALAAMEYLSTFKDGGPAGSGDINCLSTALNHALSVTMLEALAPDEGPDGTAIRSWIDGSYSTYELVGEALPLGPPETPIPRAHVEAVIHFLKDVAREAGFGG